MKANEICIGDFVRVKHLSKSGKVYRIDAANGNKNCSVALFDGDFSLDDIEPIELTPEILEKNGFKFDGSGQRSMMFISTPHFDNGIRYNIYVGLKNKTIEVFAAHPVEKSPNWRKSNKVYLEVCGCFVHELQHALRLCGIEKDIIV